MEKPATFNKQLEAGGRAGLMVLKPTGSMRAINQRVRVCAYDFAAQRNEA